MSLPLVPPTVSDRVPRDLCAECCGRFGLTLEEVGGGDNPPIRLVAEVPRSATATPQNLRFVWSIMTVRQPEEEGGEISRTFADDEETVRIPAPTEFDADGIGMVEVKSSPITLPEDDEEAGISYVLVGGKGTFPSVTVYEKQFAKHYAKTGFAPFLLAPGSTAPQIYLAQSASGSGPGKAYSGEQRYDGTLANELLVDSVSADARPYLSGIATAIDPEPPRRPVERNATRVVFRSGAGDALDELTLILNSPYSQAGFVAAAEADFAEAWEDYLEETANDSGSSQTLNLVAERQLLGDQLSYGLARGKWRVAAEVQSAEPYTASIAIPIIRETLNYATGSISRNPFAETIRPSSPTMWHDEDLPASGTRIRLLLGDPEPIAGVHHISAWAEIAET